MGEFKLTDLVDNQLINELQDMLIATNGIETGVHCADGTYITNTYHVNEFCESYIKKTEEGKKRCVECDCKNAECSLATGKESFYRCHAGLIDFTAPVSIYGKLYGFVVGGQISTEPLTREQTDKLASELGIDPDELYEASKKIKIVTEEEIKKTVRNAGKLARIISDVGKNKYDVLVSKDEIEAAAKMKSDFLANMSHEIRTPMNAIVGMADMALRETDMAYGKKYIKQIKRSSGMLLSIINDILDFSKIESGKMDINMVEYSPIMMIGDVAQILQTRLRGKDVVLILDIAPDIPGILMGDDIRIKQVITNLANNAIKFTEHGEVKLSMACEKTASKTYQFNVSVKDTGIGIKENDLNKIFDSFQQVDSKRNRNIEGTGLGLAISRNLIKLMNGELKVSSVYGEGSEFSFSIPQLELNEVEKPRVNDKENANLLFFVENEYIREQLEYDAERLGARYKSVCDKSSLEYELDNFTNLIIDVNYLSKDCLEILSKFNRVRINVLANYGEEYLCTLPNETLLHNPIYSTKLIKILNNEVVESVIESDDDVAQIDFRAPSAKILVVDDNEVNLSVCEGLLRPLDMKIDLSLSGKDAIDKISNGMYDLIFMDHMMPGMDGVETTHIIRRMHPEYDNVPIIALTANAIETAKSMFLVEGMNDFVAKPIDMKHLLKILKQWLPDEKIIPLSKEERAKHAVSLDAFDIPGIQVKHAVALIGNVYVYLDLMKSYYKNIDKKSAVIEEAYNSEDWVRYTTEVHALKSSSRQLGAMELGQLAEKLESAGNVRDIETIRKYTDDLLTQYRDIKELLSVYVQGQREEKKKIVMSADEVLDTLDMIAEALDELDATTVKDKVEKLSQCDFDDPMNRWVEELSDATDSYDFDKCEEIVKKWIERQETIVAIMQRN